VKARIVTGPVSLFPEAVVLIVSGQADLLARGLADSRLEISQAWQCVMVKVDRDRDLVPAGIIAFTVDEARSLVWVQMSFVVPEFRGQGVYRFMYEALRAIAKQHRCRTIEGATHIKNTVMRSVAKKLGRTECAIILTEEIDIEPEVRAG
jgi:GNAT superfamily N-acetyltransferase